MIALDLLEDFNGRFARVDLFRRVRERFLFFFLFGQANFEKIGELFCHRVRHRGVIKIVICLEKRWRRLSFKAPFEFPSNRGTEYLLIDGIFQYQRRVSVKSENSPCPWGQRPSFDRGFHVQIANQPQQRIGMHP